MGKSSVAWHGFKCDSPNPVNSKMNPNRWTFQCILSKYLFCKNVSCNSMEKTKLTGVCVCVRMCVRCPYHLPHGLPWSLIPFVNKAGGDGTDCVSGKRSGKGYVQHLGGLSVWPNHLQLYSEVVHCGWSFNESAGAIPWVFPRWLRFAPSLMSPTSPGKSS